MSSADTVVVVFLYFFGCFIAAMIVWPNSLSDGLKLRKDESVALVFLWPLLLCFVIASGLVELYRRFRETGGE